MDTKKIGQFISKCRKEKGMTQKEFAESIGVSDKSVSKWERGMNLPESALLMPICECLDIKVQELLLGESIASEDLLNESNKLLIDLSKKEKNDAMILYQWIIFFILLPIFIMLFSYCVLPFISDSLLNIALLCPFIFIFALAKLIEQIIHEKNYFIYFFIASLSVYIMFLSLWQIFY